jgi:hypothetical protein
VAAAGRWRTFGPVTILMRPGSSLARGASFLGGGEGKSGLLAESQSDTNYVSLSLFRHLVNQEPADILINKCRTDFTRLKPDWQTL